MLLWRQNLKIPCKGSGRTFQFLVSRQQIPNTGRGNSEVRTWFILGTSRSQSLDNRRNDRERMSELGRRQQDYKVHIMHPAGAWPTNILCASRHNLSSISRDLEREIHATWGRDEQFELPLAELPVKNIVTL